MCNHTGYYCGNKETGTKGQWLMDITNGTLSIRQEGDSDESQENKSRPVFF
ncbi:unnamed protein product [Fusarium graminearum]|uniref:Chromosome 2, complete genome n=1 Tax=Gibberella zeae (strain ATCC MYA-4620 / CBS 123657 / FGSC 9075 / NRRL 31084 / PH-1) TaxID=229533 RepID=A0A098DFL3_GIBZE|nr:unnamed protein product [Fusarium graminearum]